MERGVGWIIPDAVGNVQRQVVAMVARGKDPKHYI